MKQNCFEQTRGGVKMKVYEVRSVMNNNAREIKESKPRFKFMLILMIRTKP